MAYTIQLADSLMDDLDSVIESNELAVERLAEDGRGGTSLPLAEWCDAYRAATKRGNRWTLTFATREGLIECRDDVSYRWNFHQPQIAVRRAAARALAAIGQVLEVSE